MPRPRNVFAIRKQANLGTSLSAVRCLNPFAWHWSDRRSIEVTTTSLALVFVWFAAVGCTYGDAAPVTMLREPAQNGEVACNSFSKTSRGAMEGGAQLRVEVMDDGHLFTGGEVVMLSDPNGMPLISLACGGPWASFIVTPGEYRVSAFLGERETDVANVIVRPEGTRISLTFQPEAAPDTGAPNVVF